MVQVHWALIGVSDMCEGCIKGFPCTFLPLIYFPVDLIGNGTMYGKTFSHALHPLVAIWHGGWHILCFCPKGMLGGSKRRETTCEAVDMCYHQAHISCDITHHQCRVRSWLGELGKEVNSVVHNLLGILYPSHLQSAHIPSRFIQWLASVLPCKLHRHT